ncbi:glycosyltransferase family 2 protein [bacterium]|nr:glycosyltransferase family 2 protein [bacterium]
MKKIVLFVFVFLSTSSVAGDFGKTINGEKPIVLVIASYNNADWYKKNIDTVVLQNYSNWRIVYVDDCSPDGTGDLVEQYIKELEIEDKVTLIKNKKHKVKVENLYIALHEYCHDDEIAIIYDGDDWLAHDDVFTLLNEIYSDPEIWLTYGSYTMCPESFGCCCEELPQWVIEKNAYREYKWVTSHLRSFYAWLFKNIQEKDFKYDGNFVNMAGDFFYMLPIVEMAGGRIKFVPEALYVYNRDNPLNEDKIDALNQLFLAGFARGKKKYKKLISRP